jgi:hypothetical protein
VNRSGKDVWIEKVMASELTQNDVERDTGLGCVAQRYAIM